MIRPPLPLPSAVPGRGREAIVTVVGAMGVPEVVLLLLGAALFGALAATLARHRGRPAAPWALLGCMLGPLAILVVVMLPVQRDRVGRG